MSYFAAGYDDNSGNTYFFDARKLLTDICLVSGICPATGSASISPAPSTRIWTAPPTPPWSIEDRETKATRKPRPPRPYNPERIVGAEDEEDYDDGLEPIYVSADFLNGNGEMEVNYLLFFGFLWYWIWIKDWHLVNPFCSFPKLVAVGKAPGLFAAGRYASVGTSIVFLGFLGRRTWFSQQKTLYGPPWRFLLTPSDSWQAPLPVSR